jgi:acetolactate synthase-1/2/3 large subunit
MSADRSSRERTTAADLLVRALEHEGVEYVFGIPGEENLDLLESLRTSKIRLVVTRHEQAAGFMAATYGRLTGRAGVCLSTLGPGATNLVTAAAYAHLGAMPMVMITGQKPIKSSKQGQFQIIDVVEMMRPLTKLTLQLVNGNRIASSVREAFRIAEEERPGAAHLELPEDVAREPVEDTYLYPTEKIRRPAGEEKAVTMAAERIAAARRPLLLIGAGANRKLTSKMLQRFVDHTQIPFFTTQMGKGVLDERQELYLGTAALSESDYLHKAVRRADLVINVGHDVVEKPPFFMHPGGPEVIHINYSASAVDPVYFPQHQVCGDIANSLWQLSRVVQPQPHWDFGDFLRIKHEVEVAMFRKSRDDGFPLKPQRLVRDVRQAMPEDGIIALDNGMYKIWFARNYRAYQPNTVLLDNALATMGAGLPSAMAVALVHPQRKVLAICGDGGFLMNSQELETAVRERLDLVVLVLRDDGYGMIKWKQHSMGLPSFGLDIGNPDFVRYAESYGARGHRVNECAQFLPLLRQCLEQPGVDLIEVPVDYSENKLFTIELREAASNP